MARYLLAFIQGARLKTLPACIVPILMATTWAFHKSQIFDSKIFWFTLISAAFLQMAANFFNDALDFKFGGDTRSRKGPPRLTQKKIIPMQAVLSFGFLCATISFLAGLILVFKGGMLVLFFGLLSLLLSYLYTGHTFSLVKNGLAELSVVLFFGLIAVSLTYYLQTSEWDDSLIYLGIQCGLWSLSLLLINFLRDEKEDRLAGRKHLITVYGRTTGVFTLGIIQCLIYLLCFYWLNLDLKGGAFAFLFSVPSAILIYFIGVTPASAQYNKYLSFMSLLYVFFGASWILGLLY